METVVEQDRRLAKYESPNALSSTDSVYHAERDAFWKRLVEEEKDKGGKGEPELDGDVTGGPRRGPLEGYEGAFHDNRPSRRVAPAPVPELRTRVPRVCGPVTRIANNFPDGDSSASRPSRACSSAGCARDAARSASPGPPYCCPTRRSATGVLGFILEYYAKRSTDAINSAVELGIRDMVVLHRNVRHLLSESERCQVFSALVSTTRMCQKMGMFPRAAMERMIEDRTGAYSNHPTAQSARNGSCRLQRQRPLPSPSLRHAETTLHIRSRREICRPIVKSQSS